MTSTDVQTRTRTYELLLIMQTLAVLIILWSMLPLYRAIIHNPGHQLKVLPESPIPLVAALILFHCVYWFRLLRVPISMVRHSLLVSHVVLFLGRLSFIFGTSFFALLAYRHLPSLVSVPDPARFTMRVIATLGVLFSLYCYSTELERLGAALRPPAIR
jgi:hypothetical protein